MKSFDEFKEAMKSEAFRRELAAFLTERKPEDKTAEIEETCAFAAEKGFAVTPEELSLDKASSKQELSDEEVESAAGGEFCWSDYSCYTAYYHDYCDALMFDAPEPKYKVGQQIAIYYSGTKNWLKGTILEIVLINRNYRYRVLNEYGLENDYDLEASEVKIIG